MQLVFAFKAMNIWKGEKGIADWIGTTRCRIRTGTLVGTWDVLKHITNLLRDEWPSVIIYSYWKLRGSRKGDAWESRFSVLHWQLHDVLKGNAFILILSFFVVVFALAGSEMWCHRTFSHLYYHGRCCVVVTQISVCSHRLSLQLAFQFQRTTLKTHTHFRISFVLVKFSLRILGLSLF